MESLLELLILRLLIVVQVYVFREKKKVASFSGSILDGKSKLTNQDLLCDVHRFVICYKPVNLILQARSLFDISCTRI